MVRIRHRWSEILAEMGKELPPDFVPDRLAEHKLLSDYQSAKISEHEFLDQLASELKLSAEDAKIAHGLILMEDYPGAAQLVQEIKSAGIQVVCLSNTNALHFREFFSGRFPVCQAFDQFIASHIVGYNKPDPQIFAALETHVNASGKEILFFDDLLANVDGARAFGWSAERVDPDSDTVSFIRAELSRFGLTLDQP